MNKKKVSGQDKLKMNIYIFFRKCTESTIRNL